MNSDLLYDRTEKILGHASMRKIQDASIAVIGLGGVGSYCAESLVRAGMGRILLWDLDVVEASNLNRQLFALQSTLKEYKAQVGLNRLLDINPHLDAEVENSPYDDSKNQRLLDFKPDIVVDAIDDVGGKLSLAKLIDKHPEIGFISVMGAGNKRNPQRFTISKLSKTNTCPLAKIMRAKVRRESIRDYDVVWSDEPPTNRDGVIGTLPYVTAVAGLLASYYCIEKVLSKE